MLDLNQQSVQAIRQQILDVLSAHLTMNGNDDYDDKTRGLLVYLFAKFFNELKVEANEVEKKNRMMAIRKSEICKWHAIDDSVVLDSIEIANDEKGARTDRCNIDVYIWLDGGMQVTVYNEDVGGLYDICPTYRLVDVLENPRLIFDDISVTINSLLNELAEMEF